MKCAAAFAGLVQELLGSTRALACSDRRLAGRNGRLIQSLNGGSVGRARVVGEGTDHGTRGRVRSPSRPSIHALAGALILACCPAFLGGTRAAETKPQNDPARTAIAIEALSRLKGLDLEANPAVKAAVLKVLEATKGTSQFVELVREFRIKDQNPALLEIAVNNSGNSAGVEAARLVLDGDGLGLFQKALQASGNNSAVRTAEVLGNLGETRAVPLLEAVLKDDRREPALRKQAVRSLARTHDGAAALLKLAREEKLGPDVKFVASTELNAVRWPKLKAEAAQLLPLPEGPNSAPLPPVAELLKLKGDPVRGAEVFSRPTVACLNCHQVDGRGRDFGPRLAEVGTKLGKDALFEAILDPNAGISFGYEAWQVELKNGEEAFGLIVSETADELSIKTQDGIVTRHKIGDIARRQKMSTSIMPSGLQQTMSVQDLADLVEYLASLKKASAQN